MGAHARRRGIAQHGGRTIGNRACGHGLQRTSLILDLWSIDTCQIDVSAEQYHLSMFGLKFWAHLGHAFFEVNCLPSSGISIKSQAQTSLLTIIRIICFEVKKVCIRATWLIRPERTNHKTKVYFFFVYKYFLLLNFCVVWDYSNSERQTIRKETSPPILKKNSNQYYHLSWVSLINQALNNSIQELRFKARFNLCIMIENFEKQGLKYPV